ncbi:MAG: queuosine salvage family protein [bacterium]|nr:queuosine salvage family protein [bacterium]
MPKPKQNPVLTSTRFVIDHAEHVQINRNKIESYSKTFQIPRHTNWMEESFDLSHLNEEEKIMMCVVFNSISFSYWGDPYWSVEYHGISYDRASWSMVAAILRSKEEGKNILDPKILSVLTKEELGVILLGNTEIPLLEERKSILNLVGNIILTKYDGSFLNLLRDAKGDALLLVDTIINDFAPAFDDRYIYKEQEIIFNKRAQALVESINSMFGANGPGSFDNIEQLSGLADYVLPNLLRHLGILEYSQELSHLIDNKVVLEKGSNYEIEIRASVIWAIEFIKQSVQELHGRVLSASAINDNLWLKGGKVITPFHLVQTTAY